MRRRLLLPLLLLVAFLALPAGSATAIIGGERAELDDWPFLVAILRQERRDDFAGQFCGGALVGPRAVLTAAHCVDGPALEVVAGKTRLTGRGGETAAVVERRLPPDYDPFGTEPDLAILVLDRPLSAPAIAVAGPEQAGASAQSRVTGAAIGTGASRVTTATGQAGELTAPGHPVESAGWGLIQRTPRVFADDLREARLRVLPDWACATAHPALWIPRTQLCAGMPTARPDTCEGDSGGPLIARLPDGVPRLVGVVSYGGERCGLPQRPGVYTRTATFAAWIAAEAARAQMLAARPIEPARLTARELRAIELEFGARDCPAVTRCYVDVRTRGPVERLGGGLELRVLHLGDDPALRFARFERIQRGSWRAWTNLPYGDIGLRAYGVDASGAQATPAIRDALEIFREE